MDRTTLRSLFREIIAERQFEGLPAYLPRQVEMPEVPGKATTLIGVRRSGKTTLLRQTYDELRSAGAEPSRDLLVVNFFDERFMDLTGDELGILLEAHAELYPDRNIDSPLYVFLDEIQLVERWELFVSRLLRTPNTKVFLSGSSARLLSREVASSMRGRSLAIEIFPFQFHEYLRFQNIPVEGDLPKSRALLRNAVVTYLNEGGFPETFRQPPTVQRMILQEYYDVLLLRDVIERYEPNAPMVVRATARLLLHQAAALFTINKLFSKLRSQGLSLQKDQIAESVIWFEDAFFMFQVPIFSTSEQVRQVNPRKIYCVDTGLIRAMSFSAAENRGALLENLIFLSLRRRHKDICYYRTSQGFEIDFVFPDQHGQLSLVQVAESVAVTETRERELRAIRAAMRETGLREAVIVTLDDDEQVVQSDEGQVRIAPAWTYLLP